MVSDSRKSHLVVVTGPGWGHVKACVLVALTFSHRSESIHVTLVAFPDTFPKLDQEMSRQGHVSTDILDRMQWVEVRPVAEAGATSTEESNGYEDFFKSLMLLSQSTRRRKFNFAPNLIVYDTAMETTPTPQIIRRIAEEHSVPYVPCFYLGPVLSGGCLRLRGKEEYGGRYNGFLENLERFEKEGVPSSEANRLAYGRMEGNLLTTPDLPPIYDHELHPGIYGRGFPARIAPRIKAVLAGRTESDGYISFGTPEMEPISTDLLSKSLDPLPLYAIGPQIDLHNWNAQSPSVRKDWPEAERAIMDFLDVLLSTFGTRSTVYFCLGSQWWPDDRPELIQYLFETLLEAEPPLPFLISASATGAGITEDLRSRVESCQTGMIVSWAPQVSVLQHETIRFFMSHCGSASSTEAIMAGVPIVAWPFTADQPIWATLLCRVLVAGVQLHQVNSGMKCRALGVGGIVHETEDAIKGEMRDAWRVMRSDRYDEMREAMRQLKGTILESAEQGEVRRAIDEIVQKYLS